MEELLRRVSRDGLRMAGRDRGVLVDWDPNVRVMGNRYFERLTRCPDDVGLGDRFTLLETESGMNAPATVHAIDFERGLVYFDVDYSATQCPD